ncbi:MAG: SMP-30/gluconolactonase/LRE family protein [Chakrabartia sp.]
MGDDVSGCGPAEAALACANILGEGPVWVARETALYWVDILKPAIWRLSLVDHVADHWTPPFRISALVPRRSGGLAGAGDAGFLTLSLADNLYEVFDHPEHGLTGNRFNDGGVDTTGAFWIGSMDGDEKADSGNLYRVTADHRWERIGSGFRVPNGPAFSPDGQAAYLADSPRGLIYRYQLEADGRILGRTEFLHCAASQGFPDGMATDANGCLWVTFWDGSCVRCFNPDGALLRQIDLPVSRPTSCAFGGAALDQLFITSARTGLSDLQLAAEPEAGALFVVDPGVHGWPLPDFGG